jgi:hypothetical protein
MKRVLVGFSLIAIVLALTLWVPGAQAASLIYDNGGPNAQNGNEMTQWIQAEDFTLATPELLTDVRFWAFGFSEPGSYQGSIVWSLYGDNSGQPGGLLQRGSVVPTRTYDHVTPWQPSYQYDFSVGSIGLAASTYWLGLHNGPLTTTDRFDLYWETTSYNSTTTGNEDIVPFDSGGWYNNGQEHAFQLYGTAVIPAPAAVMLVGFGASFVGWLRRRGTV